MSFCRMTAAGEGEEGESVCWGVISVMYTEKVYAVNIVLHQKEGHGFDSSTSEVQSAEVTGLSVTLHFFKVWSLTAINHEPLGGRPPFVSAAA